LQVYTITITVQLSTAECCRHVKKSTWQRAWQENVRVVTGVNSSTGLWAHQWTDMNTHTHKHSHWRINDPHIVAHSNTMWQLQQTTEKQTR